MSRARIHKGGAGSSRFASTTSLIALSAFTILGYSTQALAQTATSVPDPAQTIPGQANPAQTAPAPALVPPAGTPAEAKTGTDQTAKPGEEIVITGSLI